MVALYARDFARAVQQQCDAAQFALHDLEVQQGHLAHQAGADTDLRQHLGGVEELALGFGPHFSPREFDRPIRGQEAGELAALALGPGGTRELELRVRAQPLQDDRLEDAGRDTEVNGLPGFALAHGGVELDIDGERAAVLEHGDVTVGRDFDAPLRLRGGVGERDGAAEQVE